MTTAVRAKRAGRRPARADDGTVVQRSFRWGALTGTVTFLYVIFFAIEIAAAGLSPRLYNRMHQLQGNAAIRLLLALVVLSALFHGLNGLRITICDLAPTLNPHERGLRFAVQFLTFAVGIPVGFVICWPSISELLG